MDIDFSKAVRRLGMDTYAVVIEVRQRLFFSMRVPSDPQRRWVRYEINADALRILAAEPRRLATLYRVLELVIAERLREGKEPGDWDTFAGIASGVLAQPPEMVARLVAAMGAKHGVPLAGRIDYDLVCLAAARKVRRDGFYDCVELAENRLNYNIGVDSGMAGTTFDFEITVPDAEVLARDLRRRQTLHWVLHTILQSTMTRTRPPVEQAEFRRIADTVLHGSREAAETLIDAVDQRHNIRLRIYIDRDMKRLAGPST